MPLSLRYGCRWELLGKWVPSQGTSAESQCERKLFEVQPPITFHSHTEQRGANQNINNKI